MEINQPKTSLNKFIDTYSNNNTPEYIKYYINLYAFALSKFKEYFPEFSIKIYSRLKSNSSFIKNVQKEYHIFFSNQDSDLDFSYLDKKVTLDINASTIVLKDFCKQFIHNYYNSSHSYRSIETDAELEKIQKADLLIGKEYSDSMSQKEYLDAKINILETMLTFYDENTKIYSSYTKYLDELNKTIAEKQNLDESKQFSSISQKTYLKFNELVNRLNYFKSSKLQNLILDKTLPIIFSDPEIVEKFHIKLIKVKESFKFNSFHASYYILQTPFGNVELQAQSSDDYWQAKAGDAAHSIFKNLDIFDFFEYVNPNDENEDIRTFLENKVDISKETFKQLLNEKKDKFKQNIKKIKLKDKIKAFTNGYDEDKDNPNAYTLKNIDDFLLDFAISNCPKFIDLSYNSHNNNSNILINEFNIVESFRELLRKKDCITYLGELLCKRLEKIVESKKGTPFWDSYMTKVLPSSITFDGIIDSYDTTLFEGIPVNSHEDDDDAR